MDDARRAVEAAARDSYGRLVAYLSSHTRDVAAAEDALADALLAALDTWPRDGVPRAPEAWLLTSARNRFLDWKRHDRVKAARVHLEQRDTTFIAVSRAPRAKIEAFQKRMGWTFKWVSSFTSDFNRDFKVSFAAEDVAKGQVEYNYAVGAFPAGEAPGMSIFAKDGAGQVYHTYSSYARGLDHLLGAYGVLDLTPKGRDEDALPFTMAWVHHHDRYAAPVEIGAR